MNELIIGLIALFFVLMIFPEIIIVFLIILEFILRLFGKSFDD